MLWLNNIQIWLHSSNKQKKSSLIKALQSIVFPLSLSLFPYIFCLCSQSLLFDLIREGKKRRKWLSGGFGFSIPLGICLLSNQWFLDICCLIIRCFVVKFSLFFFSLCLQSVCLYSSENPKFVKKKKEKITSYCWTVALFWLACFLHELVITLSSYPHCYLFLVTFSIWLLLPRLDLVLIFS